MNLSIREFHSEDKEAIFALYQKVWPKGSATHHREHVDWAFASSPGVLGPFGIAQAPSNSEIIAARPSLKWPIVSITGQSLETYQLTGTAVHPDYRRLGLFSTLTRKLLTSLNALEADFLFNISVMISRKGYEKLGWRYLPGMRRFIYFNATAKNIAQIIRSPQSLRRQTPEPTASEVVLPNTIDDLLEARHEFLRGRFHSEFDAARLKWRLSRPSEGYRILYDEKHGLCIYKIDQLPTHKEILIGEIIPLSSPLSAIRYFKHEIIRRESPLLMSMILTGGHPLRRSLTLNGFLPDPRRELNFGVRKINPRLNDDILFDPNKWALATWDIDTF